MYFHCLYTLSYLLLLSWTVTAEQFYIVPSSTTSCPRDPCYTLIDVILNPSHYLGSNSTIIFLAGHHQTNITRGFSVLIKDVRNISMIGYDHTNTDSKSVIQCRGSLGFAFINVTTLRMERLMFSFCGAHFPTVEENFVYPQDLRTKIPLTDKLKVTFYFLQTTNVTVSEVAISNSTGAGLLGINMLGLSTISQTTLSGNKPNCLIIFLNIRSISQAISPTHLNIEDSHMIFGKAPNKFSSDWGATGLGVMLAHSTYNIHVYINNVTTYSNVKKDQWYGNLHFIIENLACHCSMIRVKQIKTTNFMEKMDRTQVRLRSTSGNICKCSKLGEEEYTLHISDSYFVGAG